MKTEVVLRTLENVWRPRLMRVTAVPMLTWFLASLIVAALLLTAAFQARPTYTLGVGDTPHDTGLVRDFNAAQRQQPEDGGRRYRWTRGTSTIVFPGVGRGTTAIDLLLSGSTNPNPETKILVNDVEVATLRPTPDFRTYHVEAPAASMSHGSLTLTFVTAPFTPPKDRRTLGIAVQEVRLHATEGGFILPPARIAFLLWFGVLCAALALLIAGMGGVAVFAGAMIVAASMAAFLVWNRLFLTANTGGVVRAGILLIVVVALIRLLMPPLCRRLGLPIIARDIRWLAMIAGFVLALRFAGILHPGIIIGDLTFHVHRFEDVAVRHMLFLLVNSREVDGTILYAPTPYIVMIPLSWIIHDRVLMLFLFALGIDAIRFCIIWFVARHVSGDLLTANLVVLVMALMPVGWIAYSWGIFANLFAEGMLTVLFALLVLAYHELAGPHRWRWCALFAAVICLTLLAHVGVLVLTAVTMTIYLLGRVGQNLFRHERPWANGVIPFVIAGFVAAAVAFAIFYRFPAHDLLTGRQATPVEQEATNQSVVVPPRHQYRTGGATPDDRNGLPIIATSHLSVALALETWEMSYAFYRVWPVVACLIGLTLVWRTVPRANDEGLLKKNGVSHIIVRPFSLALTLSVWMLVAAIMLVVGIVARLYVRYPLYALPAISMSTGILLASLARRGRWGIGLAIALLTVSVAFLAFFWYSRIVYDWKVIL